MKISFDNKINTMKFVLIVAGLLAVTNAVKVKHDDLAIRAQNNEHDFFLKKKKVWPKACLPDSRKIQCAAGQCCCPNSCDKRVGTCKTKCH